MCAVDIFMCLLKVENDFIFILFNYGMVTTTPVGGQTQSNTAYTYVCMRIRVCKCLYAHSSLASMCK